MLLGHTPEEEPSHVPFQFLLGCYGEWGGFCNTPYSLSIPFRMLPFLQNLTYLLFLPDFQFLLGCYTIIFGSGKVGVVVLSIPFRMLLAIFFEALRAVFCFQFLLGCYIQELIKRKVKRRLAFNSF